MDKNETIDYLINSLMQEENHFTNIDIPSSYKAKQKILRSLMNSRLLHPIDDEFLKIQDEFLSLEILERGIIDADSLPTVPNNSKLCLWQGDITKLKIDAIVNAANSQLLGCFVPCHGCIDNAIHSAAGIQLRLECNNIMQKQGYPEATGKAKITKGYNLPCKYILHTVGPIVQCSVTTEQRNQLASCYKSCLELASKNSIKSIAFCCISTGEFHFPQVEAAKIALEAINEFLDTQGNQIERIVINAFKDEDFIIYKKLLG